MMCGGEGVGGDIACVWGRMFIAPCGAAERWWVGILWVIEDVNGTFLMFAPKFSDEGEVPSSVQ